MQGVRLIQIQGIGARTATIYIDKGETFDSLVVKINAQLGGNGILFVKPSVFAGSDKPGTWGLEVGYKVIGF